MSDYSDQDGYEEIDYEEEEEEEDEYWELDEEINAILTSFGKIAPSKSKKAKKAAKGKKKSQRLKKPKLVKPNNKFFGAIKESNYDETLEVVSYLDTYGKVLEFDEGDECKNKSRFDSFLNKSKKE